MSINIDTAALGKGFRESFGLTSLAAMMIAFLLIVFVVLSKPADTAQEYAFVAPAGMELYGCFDLPGDQISTCQWLCRSGDRIQTCTPEKQPLLPLSR